MAAAGARNLDQRRRPVRINRSVDPLMHQAARWALEGSVAGGWRESDGERALINEPCWWSAVSVRYSISNQPRGPWPAKVQGAHSGQYFVPRRLRSIGRARPGHGPALLLPVPSAWTKYRSRNPPTETSSHGCHLSRLGFRGLDPGERALELSQPELRQQAGRQAAGRQASRQGLQDAM